MLEVFESDVYQIYTCTPSVIAMFTSQYASACCIWFYCRQKLPMQK